MLEIKGRGDDWRNFILASSLNGLAEELCVDASNNKLFVSQMVAGRQLWSLCQSFRFKVKGDGQFILDIADTLLAVRNLNPESEYTGSLDEDQNKLVLRGEHGEYVKFKLGDLSFHTNPTNQGVTGFVPPREESGNRRYMCDIVKPGGHFTCPRPVFKGRDSEPPSILVQLMTSDLNDVLKKAASVGAMDIEFAMSESRPGKFSYYIVGGDNEIEIFAHLDTKGNSSNGNFKAKYDRKYMEAIVANAPGVLELALYEGDTAPLWLAYRLKENTIACVSVAPIE